MRRREFITLLGGIPAAGVAFGLALSAEREMIKVLDIKAGQLFG
jgi:hypothetical protein